MKVLELNSYDFFSTGNIMLQIADAARKNGRDATITASLGYIPTIRHLL